MQKLIGVEFDKKPNEIEIYKTGADVVLSAVETIKTDNQSGEERVVWVCDIDRYTLLEYVYYQQANYTRALSVATEAGQVAANANELANEALELAKNGNEYAQAGKIMFGEV